LALAALNTGNNLLYLSLAGLLSLMVVQNVLAEWNLRGIRLARRLPAEIFAKEPAFGELRVCNERAWFALYGLVIEEVGPDGPLGDTAVAVVDAGQGVNAPIAWRFDQRGTQELVGVRLKSSFPFGLFERRWTVHLPAQLVVYPERGRGRRAPLGMGRGRGVHSASRRGGRGDFAGLRPYVVGDSMRLIHWPSTARLGAPVVVEREPDRAGEVLVVVNPGPGQLERELARACGEIVHHASVGRSVGLRLLGRTWLPSRGSRHLREMLRALALTDGDGG
jgi:uncharacterized protein (DUF58 family)